MVKILLINLPFEKVYEKTKMAKMTHYSPPLSLAVIGAGLLEDGHDVKIFDLNLPENSFHRMKIFIEKYKPDFVGITFVSALSGEMNKAADIIKDISSKIIIIGGGPHCSSFPKKVLEESKLDIAVMGEGDFTIQEIVSKMPLEKIKGIAYRKNGKILINKRRDFIKNLDALPLPAHHLYEINKYHVSSAIARKNPVAWLETSRGCVYGCVYCNKSCFGRTFRAKSPERVVKEFILMKNLGFKEIHLTDDGFTTDIERAKRICDLLIKKKVEILWSTITGIRVDRVDRELLKKMKKAGCYRVYFGIESGNQRILNRIKKGITLEQVRNAVKWSKEAGLEVAGYFMIGLPDETEETMQQTIDFAKSLNLDLAKISITIPLPATELFNELSENNQIKTYDWEMFKFYTMPSTIYNHKNLSWKTINKYYNKFYRAVYLNPRFIFRKLKSSIKNKTILEDIKTALSINWI